MQLNRRGTKTVRFANAVLASVLALFFLLHSVLGSASLRVDGFVNEHTWVVWAMLFVVGIHVIVSIMTTLMMVTDKECPPSTRKKRHFVLKWITGAVLVLGIVGHLLNIPSFARPEVGITVVTACLLIWHVFVSTKSLARDLNISKTMRNALRIAYVVIGIVVACVVISVIL